MNILITSAGRRAYLIDYFKNTDGINKVYASNSAYSIALQRADGYLITPLIYSERYISTIIEFCLINDIKTVVSLFDIDLPVLAAHKNEFEANGIHVIVSDYDFVMICNDKWKTNGFLKKSDINTPCTYIDKKDLINALDCGRCKFPVIIKPRWGTGSIGIHVAYSYEELDVLEKICLREIHDSYLKYESMQTPEQPIIYQQFVNGTEYKLNIINNLNGEYVKTFAIKKNAIRSGETDIGITVNPSRFNDIAKKISEQSRHIGILSVDCIISDNNIYVIEFNCRICGIYPILHLAGLNYIQQLVNWLLGKCTDDTLLCVSEEVTVVKDIAPTILSQKDE